MVPIDSLILVDSFELMGLTSLIDDHMSMESLETNFHEQKPSFHALKNEILPFAVSLNKYVSSKIVSAFAIFVFVTSEQLTSE